MKNLLALLLLIHASPVFAGWATHINPKPLLSPGLVTIVYSPHQVEGSPALRGALDALARTGHVDQLTVITLHWLVQDDTFQKELMAALQASAPRELAEALRSTGNFHDPKITQLRKPFHKSVLATPTVKRINSDLSRHGLYVSGVSTEKFSIVGNNGERRFMSFLWLEVSPLPALRPNSSFKPKPLRGSA